ncbi:MAG: carboxypeptidase-like regulatory domain-containing protein [Bacteroidota bacterium]|nr:carboxypeptidase-like regulatory domain-containing protein [Bacteroidota bacterium]
MKLRNVFSKEDCLKVVLTLTGCLMIGLAGTVVAQQANADSVLTLLCKGVVVDAESGSPLSYASVLVTGTNRATVTNAEGEFSLRMPASYSHTKLMVSYMGYQNAYVTVGDFLNGKNRLRLKMIAVPLPEVNVVFKNAETLIQAMLNKRKENYVEEPTLMTAFYRETIRKRRTYVGLLESVVDVYKFPYSSERNDMASLFKVRKSTDYSKLDTIVFKLMGGPYNTLFSDVMKAPENLLTDNVFENYTFSFDRSTMLDDRQVYVLNFKQRPHLTEPLYYGKLFIDAQTLALVSAVYDLNLERRELSNNLFIRKRPLNAKVNVMKARYTVNYLNRGSEWYLGYSRVELDVSVNWKRRLFNTNYESVMEMAVTDWTRNFRQDEFNAKNRLKPNVIVSDEVDGFTDGDFWGQSNVIEPDKSIEVAISKIRKHLKNRK